MLNIENVVIITTAAPPILTGTSLNPLYRACELVKKGFSVTIIFPWIQKEAQEKIFPNDFRFDTMDDQARYIYKGFVPREISELNLKIKFYQAYYVELLRSFLMIENEYQKKLFVIGLLLKSPNVLRFLEIHFIW